MKQSIVITKSAVLSALGIGYEAFGQGLQASEHRLKKVTLFDEEIHGGEVWDFAPKEILGRKGLRTLDRNTLLVLASIQKDLAETIEAIGPEKFGLTIGTTFGSFTSLADFTALYLTEGFKSLNPMHFPNLVINSPPSQGNNRFGLTRSSTTISNGFGSGLDAVIFSADQIRSGYEEVMLAGGSEELSYHICVGYETNEMVSKSHSMAPFDKDSDGFLLGEGTALFIMETAAHAAARDAQPLAEIVSYHTCFDGTAEQPISPDAEGATYVIKQTLEEAGVSPSEIGFIASSANGYPAADRHEAQALSQAFGDALSSIPVVAHKAYFGECLAASSALQLAAAVHDLSTQQVSATPSVHNVTEDFPLWVPQQPLKRESQYALVLSCGMTGNHSAMLLKASTKDA
ncbi:MAG TPA: hypothetical protein DCE42_07270 [Myxococcales bacterium]|nr:hypothetical protein [Deltaproteobacteria bacterium]MBU48194.1 hypothetical protein [Deltaproteobacteria bacterium]HAA54540.1 hypothetical protein [Myxococcales bacterium]|tara:strand:+ start:8962 stop:10167 length:1206 start_codon:yes stop_codon:yes gene_type:complete